MIANKTSEITVTSTIEPVERIAFEIDLVADLHLMDVLSKQYSDPELAPLRELSTNARDAMVQAGKADRPIFVTLPTDMDPNLIIRDEGLGMDVTDLRETYSKYGRSTKQGTNELQGMLGIGSKSPFAYTDQFTVIAVKDGVRTEVLVQRLPNTPPEMQVVAVTDTDEVNSVEIRIPVKRWNSFASKAERLFRYWAPGTVLVNGCEPQKIKAAMKVSDRLSVVEDGEDQDVIVMGGIAYPVDFEQPVREGRIVAHVEIGTVDFAPSREALSMTPVTRKAIEALREEFVREVSTAAQKAIDQTTSFAEAFQVATRQRKLIDVRKGEDPYPYTYKGKEIPHTFTVKPERAFSIANRYSGKFTSRDTGRKQIYAGVALSSLFIEDFGKSGLVYSPAFVKKLRQYADRLASAKGITIEHFVILPGKCFAKPWVGKDRIVDTATIRKEILPRNYSSGGGGYGAPKGTYDVMQPGETYPSLVEAEKIADAELFFVNTTEEQSRYGKGEAWKRASILREHNPDCVIVGMAGNRETKFRRDFPDAKTVTAGLSAALTIARRKVNKRHVMLVEFNKYENTGMISWLKALDRSKITDPAILDLIDLAYTSEKIVKKARAKVQAVESLARFVPGRVTLPKADVDTGWVTQRYPLIASSLPNYYSSRVGKIHEHVYLYLAAVHAAGQEVKPALEIAA